MDYDEAFKKFISGVMEGETDCFEGKSDVKKGYNMSEFPALTLIDWVMRRIIDRVGTGIKWEIMTSLDDLGIVDDLVVISSKFTARIQERTRRLKRTGKGQPWKTASETDEDQCKQHNVVVIDGQDTGDVDSFDYLEAEDDTKSRPPKARGTFNKVLNIWISGQLSKNLKIRIFKYNVMTVLLYGCETWMKQGFQ